MRVLDRIFFVCEGDPRRSQEALIRAPGSAFSRTESSPTHRHASLEATARVLHRPPPRKACSASRGKEPCVVLRETSLDHCLCRRVAGALKH